MDPTYRHNENGERIDGVILPAFVHNGPAYFLTNISIYRDGVIDAWGLVTLVGFTQQVRSGWVVTQPPEGSQIHVGLLGYFTATQPSYWIDPEELIREVADEIEGLNGRPMTREICFTAWTEYEASPSEATKEALRAAYEAVPAHKRVFVLGDMDLKDHPIRALLYPERYQR